MVNGLACEKSHPLIRGLIALIGVHSCVLGILMLFVPRFMLRVFGFPRPVSIFFPSQGGIFLLILGICYLFALAELAFIKVIFISKAFAVIFLIVHVVFLSAPPVIWVMAAGDGAMFVALGATLYRYHRPVGPRTHKRDSG